MALGDGVPLTVGELLARFDLRGDGKALALVFCGNTGIDGSISAVL
jgi:hypothetical protein